MKDPLVGDMYFFVIPGKMGIDFLPLYEYNIIDTLCARYAWRVSEESSF